MSRELGRRLLVSLIGIPYALLSIYVGGWLFTGSIAFISGYSVYELLRITGKCNMPGYNSLGSSFAAIVPLAVHIFGPISMIPLLLLLIVAVGTASVFSRTISAFSGLVATIFSAILIAFPLSTLIILRDSPIWPDQMTAAGMLVYLFGGVWATDSSAYLFGKNFGKRRLAPKLSPKKTIEGAIGGAIIALIWAIFASIPLRSVLSVVDGIVIGLILGFMTQIGDLVESAIKREAGVKNSGTFFPGHGGMLDRFDSLLFAAPSVYLYLVLSGTLPLP